MLKEFLDIKNRKLGHVLFWLVDVTKLIKENLNHRPKTAIIRGGNDHPASRAEQMRRCLKEIP